jgi:hypothetical protein
MRAIALSLLLLAGPAQAATIVLDFSAYAEGDYGNSFEAAPGVLLSERSGTGSLTIATPGGVPAVLVVGDQGGDLRLDFTGLGVLGIELTFGGDVLPGCETDVFPAHLTGYAGGMEVAADELDANGNRLVDQTLAITSPVVLEWALFDFVQLGENQPESPFVGRITLTTLEVPEPALVGLVAATAAAACALRLRLTA